MTLLLETATDVCSVAIAHDNEVIAEVTAEEIHQHSSHLTIFIRQALKAAGGTMKDLRAIVLSDGPGSYTSLRVGGGYGEGDLRGVAGGGVVYDVDFAGVGG